ncbi:methylated-DNA--[protein]-cysteine S-methyltransferase [Megamonas funiformis]|jgi:methylated-DNA-[protein]-cysteine S-methyltransferase|uniref:methylated-DNA--[protein]-cysteine S-methyltransferase n=1 Tax=Megamonas funiformis TaxID=437897 RepID=UPI001CD5108A|nr:methylated-DNA--[protein]-cysteine S-methyltransferase [Megamonas funiformis]UBS48369.1 methylated-DNA--[protein]-cysteine S-methyltransferase [Megamonas funiformis]GLU99415.1 methylated-DNA--protein-cysteine methyltransferase [Megamonas funiformis]
MLYTCKYQFENISLYLVATETHLINIQFTQPQKALLQTTELLSMATIQLDEYFQGKRTTFSLPFKLTGTPFQLAVWKELQNIPYGKTTSYKEIAQKINKPKAYRAVGMANNKNPLPIIIPCHRVIGSNGKLIGYAGGLKLKNYLLELEKSHTNF